MNYRLTAFSGVRLFALALIGIALSACGDEAPPPAEVVRPVKLMTISAAGAGTTREYPGTVEATQSVEIGFEVAGKIIELPVSVGMSVNKGALLARLDPADFLAARELAEANRKAAQSAYDRAKRIFDQGAGSQAEVDQRLRDIDVAKQELKKAQKALDDATLRAPFKGEVSRKIADKFQNVQAKEPIVLLEDLSSLELDINLPEQDFLMVTPGLTLQQRTERVRPEIEVSTFPGRKFPARLISFETAADPVTRTYRATFAFDSPSDVLILPGMTAKVIVHSPVEQSGSAKMAAGMFVPVDAVVADDAGNSFVWRYDSSSSEVSRAMVTIGDMSGADILITSGLESGDTIAVAGAAHLREGMKVRPLGQ
jgi:RND family efflux transporter MFP subunit